MIDDSVLVSLLIGEACVLGGLAALIVLHRIIKTQTDKEKIKHKADLSNYLLKIIGEKKPFDLKECPIKKKFLKSTLQVLEEFNGRIQGEDWHMILKGIVEAILLQKARKWWKSLFWIRRNLSARTFVLYAEKSDEPQILMLMQDKKFLIRSPASFALVNLESHEGIKRILQAISREVGFAQFWFRDALIRGSPKVFEILVELAKDSSLHLSALDVLGAKTWHGAIPFLTDDLNSQDPKTRYLALKVLTRNLLPESLPYFHKSVSDPDPKVRSVAYQGIGMFPTDDSWALLEKGLFDSIWEVRVAAGKALKQQGEMGIKILDRQSEKISLEVAKYVMVFG